MTNITQSLHAKSVLHWLTLAGVSIDVAETPRDWLQAIPPSLFGTSPEAAAPSATPMRAAAHVSTHNFEKFIDLNGLNSFLQQWKGLGITKTASHTVLGTGVTSPALMVIGDTPDATEDQQGKAFIGMGNRLILEALRMGGFADDTLYKTYVSKWRPAGQKLLSPNELSILSALLDQEIALVQPKAILAVGESSLKALGLDSFKNSGTNAKEIIYINQHINYNIPVFASQKGELLVKTTGMKKNFWLSIIRFASATRAKGTQG